MTERLSTTLNQARRHFFTALLRQSTRLAGVNVTQARGLITVEALTSDGKPLAATTFPLGNHRWDASLHRQIRALFCTPPHREGARC